MTRLGRWLIGLAGLLAVIFIGGMGMGFYNDFIRPALITPTPTPTPSPYPATQTPNLAKVTQTRGQCFSSIEITRRLAGQYVCMYGFIENITEENGTVIYFENTNFTLRAAGRFVDIKIHTCALAEGTVMSDSYGPYIQIEELETGSKCK